jgi:hypothetical protein
MKRLVGMVGAALVTIAIAFLGAGLTIDIRHHAEHGHWIPYGWHGDVITEVGDANLAEIGGKHVQRAEFINFTLLPRLVEICVAPSGEIPTYPFRIDRLDQVTHRWETWPSLTWCVQAPVRSRIIWPLQSYGSEPGPIAAVSCARSGYWSAAGVVFHAVSTHRRTPAPVNA